MGVIFVLNFSDERKEKEMATFFFSDRRVVVVMERRVELGSNKMMGAWLVAMAAEIMVIRVCVF